MFETYFKRVKPILNLFKQYFQPKIENQRGAATEGRRPPLGRPEAALYFS